MYFVFAWNRHDYKGGPDDCQGITDTVDEARERASELVRRLVVPPVYGGYEEVVVYAVVDREFSEVFRETFDDEKQNAMIVDYVSRWFSENGVAGVLDQYIGVRGWDIALSDIEDGRVFDYLENDSGTWKLVDTAGDGIARLYYPGGK